MKYHLWDAYNPNKISVDLRREYKDKIKKFIKGDIYRISSEIKVPPARLYAYFLYQESLIPLSILIRICNRFKMSLIEMERNIILYKQMFVPIKNSIKDPRLPI